MPRSRIFYRFLISNIVVLILPVAVIFLVVYQSFVTVLGRESERLHASFLEQGIQEVENRLANYVQIAFQIQGNPAFRRERISADVTTARAALQTLKDYAAVAPGLSVILLHHYGDNVLYSSDGAYDPRLFSERVYRFENLEGPRFLERLRAGGNFDVIGAQDVTVMSNSKERLLLFIMSLPFNAPEKNAAVAFMIPEAVFMAPFGGLYRDNGTSVVVVGGNHAVVAALSDADRRSTLTKQPFELGTRDAMIGGEHHIVVGRRSEIAGLSFYSVIPRRIYDEPFGAIRSRALAALIIIAFFGSLLVSFVAYANYNPLKRLKSYADSRAGCSDEQDEIASVRRAVEQLYATSTLVGRRLEEGRAAIKEGLLRDLVGAKVQEADFTRRAADFDLPPYAEWYAVGVFRCADGAGFDDHSMVERVERLLAPYFPVLGGSLDADGTAPTFLFYLHEGDFDMLDGLLVEVHERLSEESFPLKTIGVGNPRRELSAVPDSYREALEAASCRLTRCDARVLFHAAITDTEGSTRYPTDLVEQFHGALVRLDVEEAMDAIDRFAAYAAAAALPIILVRVVCFDIITSIIKTIETMERGSGGWQTEYADIERLTEFDTVDELAATARTVLDAAKTRIERNQAAGRIADITEFIQENYRDTNFSMNMIADRFKLSVSSLSHYFKAKTGKNISDHVNKLRMEEAKRRLRESEEPVQDIVAKLGYLNVSSFIRRFRQETGMTPGAYRESAGRES